MLRRVMQWCLNLGRTHRSTATHAADGFVRWTLRRRPVRRIPLPTAMSYTARRTPDSETVADEAIRRLKSLLPITVPALVANYVEGRSPFGMYYDPGEHYWAAPPDRGLITPDTARLSKSIRRQVKGTDLEVRFDQDSETIIRRCSRADGTWLNEPLIEALVEASTVGLCVTIGAYRSNELVAGEFGLDIGGWYASMSTFHDVDGAGNVVFARVVAEIAKRGRFVACDVGEMKPHSLQFGAVVVSSVDFADRLMRHLGSLHGDAAPAD